MLPRDPPRPKGGRPKRLPETIYADCGCDSEPERGRLRRLGVEPGIARRRTANGTHLRVYRWVVERAIAWLHDFRNLRLVTEKTQEMQYAFLNLAHAVILRRITQLEFC